jgi:glycosyltransferase involved in cell wall biosynthesis
MPESPEISVVIPVLDDIPRLRLCLQALEQQTVDRDRFEVLVVDNGSRQSIAGALAEDFPAVRFLFEPAPGSYQARNAGIQAARGFLIAFTDADCRPLPDWLERGFARFQEDPELSYLAGRIEISTEGLSIDPVSARFEFLSAFRQQHYLAVDHFGATANVVVRVAPITAAVGWFDEAAGRANDVQWGRAVYARGLKQGYDPDVVVLHPARRYTEILRKHVWTYGYLFGRELALEYGMWLRVKRALRGAVFPQRRMLRWYLGAAPRTWQNVSAVLIIGSLIHYAVVVERLRIALGGRRLPR